jgi:aerobic C4-dicarboxylate transport protein
MKWLKSLYVQVLIGIVLGISLGYLWPEQGAALKPLGDAFVKAVKMLIAPIIFCTVVTGIAIMGDLKKIGRVGAKALLYFEVVTTLALLIGLAFQGDTTSVSSACLWLVVLLNVVHHSPQAAWRLASS